jgi:ABC-type sugar transport system ATPase subunit
LGNASAQAGVSIELRGVSKSYGHTRAVRAVDLTVLAGTIHALVGENGAGKSTLGKIIAGAEIADAGELRVNGRTVRFRSPADALALGITLVAQESTSVRQLSVAENVLLGRQPARAGMVRRAAVEREYSRLAASLGYDLPPHVRVGGLRIADVQKVEILRAVARGAAVIVMDEPTSKLAHADAAQLLDVLRRLRAAGTTVIYVSHSLEEVLSVADTVTVLRDGALVRTGPASTESVAGLVTAVLGREQSSAFPAKTFPPDDAAVVCEVQDLSLPPVLHEVSLSIRSGEIVGLAGLIGSGRSELAHAIYRADRSPTGRVILDGRVVAGRTSKDAIAAGIALVPEDRQAQGLVPNLSAVQNTSLAHLRAFARRGMMQRRRERAACERSLTSVDLRAQSIDAVVRQLSGGNQQKVLFARALLKTPRLLIVDEPTRGIDVGAKRSIYDLLTRLARDGMAILMISSDLDELTGVAHRLLGMRNGRLVAEADLRREEGRGVMHAALGITSDGELAQ